MFLPSQLGFTDSAAPDAETATINWGDGSPAQTVPSSELGEPASPADTGSITAGHIFGYPGTYTVTVAVTDSEQVTGTASFPVDVVDVAPTVIPGPNVQQSPGIPVSVSSTFSDPGFPVGNSAETYTASINWGDGSTSPGTLTVTPGSPGVPTTGTVSGTHTYSTHGSFDVIVTVLDSLGQKGSATLTALDTPPVVSAGADQTVDQGSPVRRRCHVLRPRLRDRCDVRQLYGEDQLGRRHDFDRDGQADVGRPGRSDNRHSHRQPHLCRPGQIRGHRLGHRRRQRHRPGPVHRDRQGRWTDARSARRRRIHLEPAIHDY